MSNLAPVTNSDVQSTVASDSPQVTQIVEDLLTRIRAQLESDSEDDSSPESESVPPAPEWNGDPMEWESWPSGRPGPYVPEPEMRVVMDHFRSFEEDRGEWSREKEKVFHIAEFSTTCGG